ncbi:MerR family DNA-binding transcriptional regulator [Halioxenophilus aromaticivorans]|uniref:HTH merR-type domain-containing protein n=1 Tax=Halioxenophilus aromaticivorans TaxID=1306992 RepID=A0AAV3U7I1_9ALTE
MTSNYSIGQLAKAAGVNVQTICNYERQGLITQPPKPALLIQVREPFYDALFKKH